MLSRRSPHRTCPLLQEVTQLHVDMSETLIIKKQIIVIDWFFVKMCSPVQVLCLVVVQIRSDVQWRVLAWPSVVEDRPEARSLPCMWPHCPWQRRNVWHPPKYRQVCYIVVVVSEVPDYSAVIYHLFDCFMSEMTCCVSNGMFKPLTCSLALSDSLTFLKLLHFRPHPIMRTLSDWLQEDFYRWDALVIAQPSSRLIARCAMIADASSSFVHPLPVLSSYLKN